MKFLDGPKTITLKRTQYAIRNKRSRWQRFAARFTQALALVTIAGVVAGVIAGTLMPSLLPIPA